jgi:hypothetical protein
MPSVTTRSSKARRPLGPHRPGQGRSAGQVVWVYAITDGLLPDQLSGLTGVAGERIRAVTEGSLTAIVGSVDAGKFGEHARPTLLSDLASIERIGRAHHQVIACVATDGPVLPLRLATVYEDDSTVRALLERGSAEFTVMLESFRGTEEWGVKIYKIRDDAGAPEGGGPKAGADESPGADLIDRALSGIAVASRRQPAVDPRFDDSREQLVLNAAYLLNSDRADEFGAVARALERANGGVRAEVTGPWPPYSFADVNA